MSENALGTNLVTQVAIVCKDIDATAAAWAELLGVPQPQAGLTGPAEESNTRYRGETTDGRAKLAFLDLGPVRLELIEPVGGPSTWRAFLNEKGEGVHHIAFRIENMDETLARLNAMGMATEQRGDFTGGRYGYVDSRDKLKVTLELLEHFGA